MYIHTHIYLDNSHPGRCERISHCGSDLHFPDDEWWWVPFHIPVGNLYVWRHVYSSSLHIFLIGLFRCFLFAFLLLSCRNLSVLDINPLSILWLENIFSYSVDYLFISLILLLYRNFLIWCSPTCIFLLLLPGLLMSYPINYCQDQ